MKVIEFLISYEPFVDNLTYAPIRVYSSREKTRRIYHELYTGDWWWETQKQLPNGATIVPLLLGTDKTLLTMLHGDQSVWPIYLTIGNLDAKTRRSQLKPSTILLGFIPIPEQKKGSLDWKSAIWHRVMEQVLLPLETQSRSGVQLLCADGYVRECFPIIAGFMVDYEEQAMITGIKCMRQCTICTVPPDERQNLTGKKWELRTHESTIAQLEHQKKFNIEPSDDDWIHPIRNFAWNHYLINIHQSMMIDILHQLLKGAVMDLVQWIKDLLTDMSLSRAEAMENLDKRFREVPVFPGLKHFPHFSNIKQWGGDEQKAFVRQLIPVVAPLLGSNPALQYARAVVDFVLIAQYATHDDETLEYLNQAIFRMDCFKWAFADYRPINTKDTKPHFNIPKLHAITHYVQQIKLYGSAVGIDSAHFEAAHRYLVKAFFDRTNKRKNEYEQQILFHNTRLVNLLAMKDILDYRTSGPAKNDMRVKVTKASGPLNISNWKLSAIDRCKLRDVGLPTKYWREARSVALHLGIPDLIDALAVFVRECRNRMDNVSMSHSELDRRDLDPSWVSSYYISIHPSITCWKREAKNPKDVEELSSEFVRCCPNWQGKLGNWRRDYVFLQEYEKSRNGRQVGPSAMEGKMVGQLQLVLTVMDLERSEQGNCVKYTGALIEILRFRNSGAVSHRHGMVEVEKWQESNARNPRSIGARRIYQMSTILRSAHIVPTGLQDGVYYINNYVDWDTYNTIYDPDFLDQGIRAARTYMKQVKRSL